MELKLLSMSLLTELTQFKTLERISSMMSKMQPIKSVNLEIMSEMPCNRPSIHPNQHQFHKFHSNKSKFLNNQKLLKFPKKHQRKTYRNNKNTHKSQNHNLPVQDQVIQ